MQEMSKLSVADTFDILDEDVRELCRERPNDEYVMKFRDFWHQVKNEPAAKMSKKQAAWLSTMETSFQLEWRPKWMSEGKHLDTH